jgi:hypothetical protein
MVGDIFARLIEQLFLGKGPSATFVQSDSKPLFQIKFCMAYLTPSGAQEPFFAQFRGTGVDKK